MREPDASPAPTGSLRAGPPVDPELAPILTRLVEHMPRSLTPDVIDVVRETSGRYEPDDEQLRRGGQVEVEELLVPGPAGAPDVRVLVCRPSGAPVLRGTVLYTHGGGMVMGSARTGLEPLLDWVTELQVAIVSVDYRLAPEHRHPAPVEDCYAALLWTEAQLGRLGAPAGHVVIAGGSAGGGLAAAVALLARDRRGPQMLGQVLMSPMLDHRCDLPSTYEVDGYAIWDRTSNLSGWAALLGAAGDGTVSPYASPALAEDLSGLPPAYIDVGSAEALRDEGVQYASRIWQAGGEAELHVWQGGFHGFDTLAPTAQVSIAARARRTEWIRRLLDGGGGS